MVSFHQRGEKERKGKELDKLLAILKNEMKMKRNTELYRHF